MEPRNGKYQNYKGNFYEVVGIAVHTETKEEFVVYRSLYGNYELWIRPRKMFLEEVEWEGKKQQRFRLIEERLSAIANPPNTASSGRAEARDSDDDEYGDPRALRSFGSQWTPDDLDNLAVEELLLDNLVADEKIRRNGAVEVTGQERVRRGAPLQVKGEKQCQRCLV